MSQRLATIISCTHYRAGALQPFNRPGPETEALAATLLDPDIGNFESVETFVDRPAGEILIHLEELFKYRKPYDLICLYYAGLGLIDQDGQVYLATIDSNPNSLAGSAIAVAELSGWMDNSFSRQQILILDNTYITVNMTGERIRMVKELDLVETFRGKGYWRLLLSSSAIAPPVQQAEPQQAKLVSTLFTDLILRGLETGDADIDKDGLIGLRDFYSYLKREMQRRGAAQRPHIYTFLEKEDFVLAKTVTATRNARRIKWDVLSGAISLPIAILILGWKADIIISVEAAVIFLFFYAVLYRYGD